MSRASDLNRAKRLGRAWGRANPNSPELGPFGPPGERAFRQLHLVFAWVAAAERGQREALRATLPRMTCRCGNVAFVWRGRVALHHAPDGSLCGGHAPEEGSS